MAKQNDKMVNQPMPGETRPPPVCGFCMWYRKIPLQSRGICVCLPPTPIAMCDPMGNVNIVPARPPVAASESCGQWTMREGPIQPAVPSDNDSTKAVIAEAPEGA